jgi:hypothetical protein
VTIGQIAAIRYNRQLTASPTAEMRPIYLLRVISAMKRESRREAANLMFIWLDDVLVAMGTNDEFDFDIDFGLNVVLIAASVAITLVYSIALALLDKTLPTGWFLVLATAVIWLAYWFPATRACGRGAIIFLRRPNRFVDVYEDSRSAHWVAGHERAGSAAPRAVPWRPSMPRANGQA